MSLYWLDKIILENDGMTADEIKIYEGSDKVLELDVIDGYLKKEPTDLTKTELVKYANYCKSLLGNDLLSYSDYPPGHFARIQSYNMLVYKTFNDLKQKKEVNEDIIKEEEEKLLH